MIEIFLLELTQKFTEYFFDRGQSSEAHRLCRRQCDQMAK